MHLRRTPNLIILPIGREYILLALRIRTPQRPDTMHVYPHGASRTRTPAAQLALLRPIVRRRLLAPTHIVHLPIPARVRRLAVRRHEPEVLETPLERPPQAGDVGRDDTDQPLDDGPHADLDALGGRVVGAAESGARDQFDHRRGPGEHAQCHQHADDGALAEGPLHFAHEVDGQQREDDVRRDVDGADDDAVDADGGDAPAPSVAG